MKRILRSAAALLFGFGVTIAALGVSAKVSEDKNGSYIGKLDFQRYCQLTYGTTAGAYAVAQDAYGWRCATRPNGLFTPRQIVADLACEKLYGTPSHAQTFDATWLFSWECFRGLTR
ncbi:MAG: hypothetical protein JWM12_3452 [Ilumatobacteraceae bacterium]|nr:hypothetical protein [Ilumatobacteraceae bacterium]